MGGDHLTWQVKEKSGNVYDPLEAIALVVLLPVERCEGVMYKPNIYGFEPLRGDI